MGETVTHLYPREWFRNAALRSAAQGFYVIPLWPGTKVPALHGSRCPGRDECRHGHRSWEQRATRDPHTIDRWWRSIPLNVGIATGPSGLHVLDLDAAQDAQPPARWEGCRDGRDVLARIADRAGAPYPGATRTVRTPTGGQHLYFRAPADVRLRNTVARIGWRIDSRGEGGFVVAEGAQQPHGSYELLVDAAIAPLPRWLIPLLRPPSFVSQLESVRPNSRDDSRVSEVRRHAYLATIEASVGATRSGERHDVLLRAAYTLGRLVAGGDFTEEETRAALRDAASVWAGSPSRKDLRTIHDGLAAGMRHPRRLAR